MMKNLKNLTISIRLLWESSKGYFVLTFLLSVLSSVPDITLLLVWQKIIDVICELLLNKKIEYRLLLFYIILHFLLTICASIIQKINLYNRGIYSLKVEKYVSNKIIDIVETMNLSDLENAEVHNMIKKTEESSDKTMELLSKLVQLVENITMFIGMAGILIAFDIKVFIIIFISVIPMAIYSQSYFNKLFEVYDQRFEKIRYGNELKDMIHRSDVFKEIKIFHSISYLRAKINKILDDVIAEDRKTKRQLDFQGTYSEIIENVFIYILKGLIIFVGVRLRHSIGTINMNIESATSLQTSISNIVFNILEMYEDGLYLESFSKLLEYQKKILEEKREKGQNLITDFQIETIELKNIWYRYTDQSDYVIKDVSCRFLAGNTYAIVGYNGGGKTTLIKIIMGLYVPQKGQILINGKDINHYDIDEYMVKISAVFQDFVKYPMTVQENIAIGNIEKIEDMSQIKEAAQQSCADQFIDELPQKYDTRLVRGWKDSVDLSIGQWQRIAIARANMIDGQIVIFDEPSASLDAKTESRILNHVMDKDRQKISIIITHRFLNIKRADEIIVIRNGEIEAVGQHYDLLERGGTYQELYDAQSEMI